MHRSMSSRPSSASIQAWRTASRRAVSLILATRWVAYRIGMPVTDEPIPLDVQDVVAGRGEGVLASRDTSPRRSGSTGRQTCRSALPADGTRRSTFAVDAGGRAAAVRPAPAMGHRLMASPGPAGSPAGRGDARQQLLPADWTTYPHPVEQVAAPAAVVAPRSPYRERLTNQTELVNLQVALLLVRASDTSQIDELDWRIDQVQETLELERAHPDGRHRGARAGGQHRRHGSHHRTAGYHRLHGPNRRDLTWLRRRSSSARAS